MSQNLQNFVKFQKFQLENLVDFEKCCKTHIFLQKSVPIQPKTSNILPKFCRSAAEEAATDPAAGLPGRVEDAAGVAAGHPAAPSVRSAGPRRRRRQPPGSGASDRLRLTGLPKTFFSSKCTIRRGNGFLF